MWKPFSKTDSHFFRKQAALAGESNVNFGKSIKQFPRLVGVKPKLHQDDPNNPVAKAVARATDTLNRHHANKLLARYPKGRIREAAYVVMNTPTGKIGKQYVKALRLLAKEEAIRAAQNKSWKVKLGIKSPMTAGQMEAACLVADEKNELQRQREVQQLAEDHGKKISQAASQRKADRNNKLGGPKSQDRERQKLLSDLSEFDDELTDMLNSINNVSDEKDQLVVIVKTDSSESESEVDSSNSDSRS
jgi:hypothetical protein